MRDSRLPTRFCVAALGAAAAIVLMAGMASSRVALAQNSQDIIPAMNAALQRGDCQSASTMARQVVARHKYGSPEAAYANLTLGTCLLRAKRWSAAQRVLRLARPLSGRAAQTRRRLEHYVAEREREEARSPGSSTASSSWKPVAAQPYWQPQAPVIMPSGPAYGKVPQKPRVAPTKPPKASGSTNSFSATPAISYSRSDSAKSFSGLRQSSASSLTTKSKVNLQARSESPMGYAGGDALAFTLPVELSYVQESSTSDEVSFKRNTDTATTVFGVVSESGSSAKTFMTTATPSLTVPLTGSVELEGTFLYSLSLPDFAPAGKSSRRNPSASVDIEAGAWTITGVLSYDERLDSTDARTSSSMTLSGNVSYGAGSQTWSAGMTRTDTDVPVDLRSDREAAAATSANVVSKFGSDSADYKFSGNWKQVDPFPGLGLRAPGQELSGKAEVDVPFGVFSVGGSFTYESLSDIVQPFTIKEGDVEVTYQLAAEASRMTVSGGFDITAFKWLALGMTYSYVTTDYQTNNPLVEKEFRRKNADLSNDTTVTAAIFREF